ncbi:MAG: type II toxin-antitoxin system CcdA family antitoxin [Fervidicoccaceae archaeon]
MKKLTTVKLDEEVYQIAKDLGINLSLTLELAILRIAQRNGYDVSEILERILKQRKLTTVVEWRKRRREAG